MTMYVSKFGDWAKAGKVLKELSAKLQPTLEARLKDNGELILKTMREHIERQDLPWKPLAERTVQLKQGDTTIYVETGWLKDNLSVRKIRSTKNDMTIFIGASPWKKTPDGVKFSDLMIWLEYGTDKIPPRPLVRATWSDLQPIIEQNWEVLLKRFIESGGAV